MLSSSCKEHDDNIAGDDPFKVSLCLPLTDVIPFETLGSGKIVFDRTYNVQNGSGYYVIDIDKKTTSGFRLNGGSQQPNISPDGTRIACTMVPVSYKLGFNICIMNIDGSNCFSIIQSSYKDTYPTWTPDGSKVIFWEGKNEGPLYMMSPIENARDTVILTKFYYGDDPEWFISPSGGFSISPDQKLVCVSYGNKLSGILLIDPYVGKSGVNKLLPFTANQGFESPVFSPDGQKIAFLSIEHDSLDYFGFNSVAVKSINPDGTNLSQLVKVNTYKTPVIWSHNLRMWDVSLCWSPDGTKILFTAPTEEYGCHLFVINSDGSGLTQVTDNVNAYDADVSWSR